MPKVLKIFDFDGTLFRSPVDSPNNRKKYERETGLPWLIDKETSRRLSKEHGKFIGMRQGWFGRAETLLPPLVPNPAPKEWFIEPVCENLLASKKDQNTVTIILTGRHSGLKNQVLRICRDGHLVIVNESLAKDGQTYFQVADPDIQCLCLGDKGPLPKGNKPSETFPWKTWIIEQYVELLPELEIIEIWEDRTEHVEKFNALSLKPEVIVHYVA